jgi:L-fuculose-phosphate aldolase
LTPALAVVHAHPRHAIAMSLMFDEIIPIDNECSYLLKRIPVVEEEFASGTPQMAQKIAEALRSYKIVMLRGHGSFSTGQTLDEAFQWTDALEEACEIIFYKSMMGGGMMEYRRMAESYTEW